MEKQQTINFSRKLSNQYNTLSLSSRLKNKVHVNVIGVKPICQSSSAGGDIVATKNSNYFKWMHPLLSPLLCKLVWGKNICDQLAGK